MLLWPVLVVLELVLLALGLRLFLRYRALKKRQDALVAKLQGRRHWRINMARPPFARRWLRLLPFEAKGVLIDEGGQLRLQGFWLHSAKAFDVVVDKAQCQAEWLGTRGLRTGNLCWAQLETARWCLRFCADTGLHALPSRAALADIFRQVFPQAVQDNIRTKGFVLWRNPRCLMATVLCLALWLFALLDTWVLSRFELVDASSLLKIAPLLGLSLALLALAVWLYRWLIAGLVPTRAAVALAATLALGVAATAVPLAKRADQSLAGEPAQMHVYRTAAPSQLEPVDAAAGLPRLQYPQWQAYWAQFPDGTAYRVPLLRGPLGLWQVDRRVFDVPIEAFYQKP